MEEKVCAGCGQVNPANANYCTGCGSQTFVQAPPESGEPAPGQPLLTEGYALQISTVRIIVLSIVTSGVYVLYWLYRTWKQLPSDDGAQYDRTVRVDAASLEPMITWGTNPGMGVPITQPVPEPNGGSGVRKALDYMQLEPGKPLLGQPVDVVFVGSCTNSRISDLREAANLLKGRKVSSGVRMLVVPGSEQIRAQAESEGLSEVFRMAGADWREAGCSMCIAMNGDQLDNGQYCVSTSNRNFEGRQGKGGRTFLASPLTAAATAIEGAVADPRRYL